MVEDVIKLLEAERAKIDQALSVLGRKKRGRPAGSTLGRLPKAKKIKRGGVWTPERRAAQAKRLKALWKKKGKSAFNKV